MLERTPEPCEASPRSRDDATAAVDATDALPAPTPCVDDSAQDQGAAIADASAIGPYRPRRVDRSPDGVGWVGRYQRGRSRRSYAVPLPHVTNREAAVAALKAHLIALLARETPPPPVVVPQTVDEFVRQHLAALERRSAPSSRQYVTRWRLYGRPFLGHRRFDELTEAVMIDWVELLKTLRASTGVSRPLSPRWVNAIFDAISSCLSYAVPRFLAHNPCSRSVRRHLPPKEGPAHKTAASPAELALEVAELRALLTLADLGSRDRVEYLFTSFACTRLGETRGARFSDLHLTAAVPYVWIHRSWETTRTKNRKDREVPIHPELLPWLRWWSSTGFAAYVGRAHKPDDYLFPRHTGAIHRSHAAEELRERLAKAGVVRPFTYHGLRHSGASAYTDAGVPDKAAEVILGHAPAHRQTAHYARARLRFLAAEIEKLRLGIPAPEAGPNAAARAVFLAERERLRAEAARAAQAAKPAEAAESISVCASAGPAALCRRTPHGDFQGPGQKVDELAASGVAQRTMLHTNNQDGASVQGTPEQDRQAFLVAPARSEESTKPVESPAASPVEARPEDSAPPRPAEISAESGELSALRACPICFGQGTTLALQNDRRVDCPSCDGSGVDRFAAAAAGPSIDLRPGAFVDFATTPPTLEGVAIHVGELLELAVVPEWIPVVVVKVNGLWSGVAADHYIWALSGRTCRRVVASDHASGLIGPPSVGEQLIAAIDRVEQTYAPKRKHRLEEVREKYARTPTAPASLYEGGELRPFDPAAPVASTTRRSHGSSSAPGAVAPTAAETPPSMPSSASAGDASASRGSTFTPAAGHAPTPGRSTESGDASDGVRNPIGAFLDAAGAASLLRDENARLREENARMRVELQAERIANVAAPAAVPQSFPWSIVIVPDDGLPTVAHCESWEAARAVLAFMRATDSVSIVAMDPTGRACGSAPELEEEVREQQPIPLLLWCPECGERHVDVGTFATKVHHTHACQECGHVWRPAIGATVGVRFLPGFKNGAGDHS